MTAAGAIFAATIAALDAEIDACAASDDRAGYFPAMYCAVTKTVARRTAQGEFTDAERMERFVGTFADRYLSARRQWRAGAQPTASWDITFRTARRWRPIVLQHLLLGINAHINLDLGVAAATIAGTNGLEVVRGDFEAVNDVLGDLVGGCQAVLAEVSPWIGLADRVSGRGDDALIRFSLRAARQQAWHVAERLVALDPADRAGAVAAVDASTARLGRRVAHPGVWASAVLLLVRSRERAAPHEVIALLRDVVAR